MTDRESNNISRKSVLVPAEKFSITKADWHPADIKAGWEKRGLSLADVSRAGGYHPTAAGRALRTSWPEVERLIAEALGEAPWTIWPSRYVNQVPKKYLPRRNRDSNGSARN